MKSKLLNGPPQRTWVLVFAPEDEPVKLLTGFAEEQHILAARISGIGGFSEVTLGYFNLQTKEYEPIPVREQVEVMSLLGNIALFANKTKLHAHVVIGKRDGSAHGGHLLEAKVRPTLEVFIVESPVELRRETDPATGLPLLGL
jgi:predicted DNA-binding protein with PD1-like motif